MKTDNFLRKAASFTAVVALGFAFSCQEDETPFAAEVAYVAEETITDYYYEDADDIASVAVAAEAGTGGKLSSGSEILSVNDDRLCALVTVSFDEASTLEHPLGTLGIDFEDGCTDPRGNTRSGKIIVRFDGRRFLPGSTLVITFIDYVINGIKLNGTRTLTNITGSNEESPKFQIELEDGEVEWPDGTLAFREHCYVRTWDRGVLNDASDDVLVVSICDNDGPTATGMSRRGDSYTMTIDENLIYKRGCPIAIQGVKIFRINGKEIIVDYGDGACDNVLTITVDGTTSRVDVKKRG